MIETALAKLLTLKVAAATVVAVAATGGVALAASNGALPNPLRSNTPSAGESAHPTARPSRSAGGEHDAATPSPSLIGLCKAYTAGAGVNPGKALENPAFGALITAAGGRDKVDGYCVTALAANTSSQPTPTRGGGQSLDHGTPSTRPSHTPETASSVRTTQTPDNTHKPTAEPTPSK